MKTKILFLLPLFIGLAIRLSAQNKDTYMTSNNGCKVLCSNCTSDIVSVSWDGKCLNGYASGYGTRIIYYNDQTKGIYIGSVISGKREGKGKFIGRDNSKYEGGWVNNKIQGYGFYAYSNGDKFEGNFSNGLHNGQGTYTFNDGSKWVGTFVNGFGIKGKRYYPSGKLQVVGVWKNNGGTLMDGTSYYEDGGIYATYSNGIEKLSRIAQLEKENQELKSKSYESNSKNCVIKEISDKYNSDPNIGEYGRVRKYEIKIGDRIVEAEIKYGRMNRVNGLYTVGTEQDEYHYYGSNSFRKFDDAFESMYQSKGCSTYNFKK